MMPGHWIGFAAQTVIEPTCNFFFNAPSTCGSIAVAGHEVIEAVVDTGLQAGIIDMTVFNEINGYKLGTQIAILVAVKLATGPIGLIADTTLSIATTTATGLLYGMAYDFFADSGETSHA